MFSTRFCIYKKTEIQQFAISMKMFHVKHLIRTFLEKRICKSVIMNSVEFILEVSMKHRMCKEKHKQKK